MATVTTCLPAVAQKKLLGAKRTNSLGWAKSDCHKCSSLQRVCDRRRPRCTPCISDGIVCSGYVQELNWERGSFRLATLPDLASSGPTGGKSGSAESQLAKPSQFIFVDQIGAQRRQKRRSSRTQQMVGKTCSPKQESPLATHVTDPSSLDGDEISFLRSPVSMSTKLDFRDLCSAHGTLTPTEVLFPLYPSVSRRPGDIEESLSFYHGCFSLTTLTYDVEVNPWQAALPMVRHDVPCLLYVVLALVQRQRAHLERRPESLAVLELKNRALAAFAMRLNELSCELAVSTSLLLIALDYAETGYSNWVVHLQGAYRMLEAQGGISIAVSRTNLRSQIAMLLWYDMTAALFSRRGPIFPRSYAQALMVWRLETEWSILALNGCPDSLVLDMYDIAAAAAGADAVSAEDVAALEMRLWNAKLDVQGDKDLAALADCWRLGLLLYCGRVFHGRSGRRSSSSSGPEFDSSSDCSSEFGFHSDFEHESRHMMSATTATNPRTMIINTADDDDDDDDDDDAAPAHLTLLGEEILRLVLDLPPDSNVQKQCLLPVILAGCEMEAHGLDGDRVPFRRVATDFCERWKTITGLWIFNSALELMTRVWALMDREASEQSKKGSRSAKRKQKGPSLKVGWVDVIPRGASQGYLFG